MRFRQPANFAQLKNSPGCFRKSKPETEKAPVEPDQDNTCEGKAESLLSLIQAYTDHSGQYPSP